MLLNTQVPVYNSRSDSIGFHAIVSDIEIGKKCCMYIMSEINLDDDDDNLVWMQWTSGIMGFFEQSRKVCCNKVLLYHKSFLLGFGLDIAKKAESSSSSCCISWAFDASASVSCSSCLIIFFQLQLRCYSQHNSYTLLFKCRTFNMFLNFELRK